MGDRNDWPGAESRVLAHAIEQTADSVIVTDVAGRITYVNASFERLTGYSRDEVIGRSPNVVKSGFHDRAFYARLWSTIASGRPFRDVFVNRGKGGELIHEEKTITPIRCDRGRIVRFLSTAKDMSRRHGAGDAQPDESHAVRPIMPVDLDPFVGDPGSEGAGAPRIEPPARRSRGAGAPEGCDPFHGLSRREQDVLLLVLAGLSSKDIAKRLAVAPATVDTYRSRLMAKVGVDDVASLVRLAVRHRIIEA